MTEPFTTQINNTNIYTKAWETFFNLIKNNVDDPKERSITWIFGSIPKNLIEYENGDSTIEINKAYPIIIINNIEVGNQINHSINYTAKEYNPMISINIFSDRSDYLDSISNEVIETILESDSSFSNIGLFNINIISDNVDFNLSRSGLKIFNRELTISFEVI